MPIFDYKCDKCGKVHEFMLFRSDDFICTTCFECGGDLKKVPPISSFQLKGQGWSKDGYSSKKKTALDRVPR